MFRVESPSCEATESKTDHVGRGSFKERVVSSRDTFVGGRVVALFYLLFLAVTAADGEQRHQTDDGNVTHE